MSPLWIGTSWKMTKTLAEARAWATGLRDHLGGAAGGGPTHDDAANDATRNDGTSGATAPSGVQPFVIPSFTATTTVAEVLGEDSPVLLGVQNAHWEDAGAWTGEVSVPQAKDAGAQMVEIGHSERREHFGETVETTRWKVAAALRHGLTPLLCIGESAEVKEAGGSSAFILEQAAGALRGLGAEELARVVIAYEPIWAIGEAGRPATIEELIEPFAALGEACSGKVAGLLYGGSVNLDNAADLLGIEHVSGLFVGRTAWRLEGYLELLRLAEEHAAGRRV
ncbi:triose-phosphate isomerase [Brachybacterium fresconis]|uniref:Triosephosphate isomerase n=1 Tax=Brachybacterium fresconis TaxID=173363 RepID=A0ABS4YLQ4_9MICO|nr:triose-phosphate isomerase [Brachybacterium fresconis]MBP2409679.1 triosephosphate isomerase [Brachybacterium fresconis]